MDRGFLTPLEISRATISSAEVKAKLSTTKLLILGMMAGLYIGLGGFAYIIVSQTLGNIDVGLARLLGASVFPVGLMLVVFTGSELFTGNNLMTMAVMDGKITIEGLLRNWILVYLGNFIGSVLLAYAIYNSKLMTEDILSFVLNSGVAKTSIDFHAAFLRGVLCNILVVLSIWSATGSKDMISKVFAIWFPIMLFVLSGYEHSIANMFFIPLAKVAGSNISWIKIWTSNLIPVTLGNIAGGAILVPIIYYISYIIPKE